MFGKWLLASAMVFSLGLRLMSHNNIHTFSYGYDKLRFSEPVFCWVTGFTPSAPILKDGPSIRTWAWCESRTKCSKCRGNLCFIASTCRRSSIGMPRHSGRLQPR